MAYETHNPPLADRRRIAGCPGLDLEPRWPHDRGLHRLSEADPRRETEGRRVAQAEPVIPKVGRRYRTPENKEQRSLRAFLRAALWADDIKSDGAYDDADAKPGSNGNEPSGSPENAQNIGYTDKHRHKYWHFHDMAFTTDGQLSVNRQLLPRSNT